MSRMGSSGGADAARPPRLLDQVRAELRLRHYSERTEAAYVQWIRRFILFHEKRHPLTLGARHVAMFLTHLATEAEVSASTQNQALNALMFLYGQVLGRNLEALGGFVRARKPQRLPVVLTVAEVRAVLEHLHGSARLVASLLYGSGLRLLECLELRVKDLDLDRAQILVRQGKGRKDRVTPLPRASVAPLRTHLAAVRRLHDADLRRGLGRVIMPDGLALKYPGADASWPWQFVFPAGRLFTNPATCVGHPAGLRRPSDHRSEHRESLGRAADPLEPPPGCASANPGLA
jgi:integron integrase